MRVCLFEDPAVRQLEPLTLTRPVFDVRCGLGTLLDRHRRLHGAGEVGALVRPHLERTCREQHPDLRVNDLDWLRAEPTVMINARWLADEGALRLRLGQVGLVGEQVAAAVPPAAELASCRPETIAECLERWKASLHAVPLGGSMIEYPWDLIRNNVTVLSQDCQRLAEANGRNYRPAGTAIVGQSDQLTVAASARIEDFVLIDTSTGPVFIDDGAVVEAFSRIEGPCYIGTGARIVGARIRGSTIGPGCRVGGEVEHSILHGFVNKYHDGFIGHSYVGEWVNVAAGVQISDLRHDYMPVKVPACGCRIDTGLVKVGAFIGDHTKIGLGVMLNTGTTIGVFSSLLPMAGYHPREIPSFHEIGNGVARRAVDVAGLLRTATVVMQRRGRTMTPSQRQLFSELFRRESTRSDSADRTTPAGPWRLSA